MWNFSKTFFHFANILQPQKTIKVQKQRVCHQLFWLAATNGATLKLSFRVLQVSKPRISLTIELMAI